MKVVVTGASGTVGRALAREILARGSLRGRATGDLEQVEEVTLIDIVAYPGDVPDGATFLKADLTSPGALAVISGGVDAIFHLAHTPPQTSEDNFDLGMKVNLTVLQGLLSRCRRSEVVPLVIFPSSHLVYGASGDLDPATSFGAQKLMGELLVRDMTRKGFIDGRCVRLPFLAAHQPEGSPLSWATAALRGEECLAPGDTPVRAVSLAGAVRALLHAHDVGREVWGALVGGGSVCLPGTAATAATLVAAAGGRGCGGNEDAAAFARALTAELDGSVAAALGFEGPESLEDLVPAEAPLS